MHGSTRFGLTIQLASIGTVAVSSYFLYFTLERFLVGGMDPALLWLMTIVVGLVEILAIVHLSRAVREHLELHGGQLRNVAALIDFPFATSALILVVAAAVNVAGSFFDLHERLAGAEALTEYQLEQGAERLDDVLAGVNPQLDQQLGQLDAAAATYGRIAAYAKEQSTWQLDPEVARAYRVAPRPGPRRAALAQIARAAERHAGTFSEKADRVRELREQVNAPIALEASEAATAIVADGEPETVEAATRAQVNDERAETLQAVMRAEVEADNQRAEAWLALRGAMAGVQVPQDGLFQDVAGIIGEIQTLPDARVRDAGGMAARVDQAMTSGAHMVALEALPTKLDSTSAGASGSSLSDSIMFAVECLQRGEGTALLAMLVAFVLDPVAIMFSGAWLAILLLPAVVLVLLRDVGLAVVYAFAGIIGGVAALPAGLRQANQALIEEEVGAAQRPWRGRHIDRRLELVLAPVLRDVRPDTVRSLVQRVGACEMSDGRWAVTADRVYRLSVRMEALLKRVVGAVCQRDSGLPEGLVLEDADGGFLIDQRVLSALERLAQDRRGLLERVRLELAA